MGAARSRITAQGQITVPAVIRRKLGVGPGSVLEWDADGDQVIVRRAGKYDSDDVHKALFPKGPPPRRSLAELTEGIRQYIRNRHAGGRY
jgi:AbrB family looped-hinge helix DNA binding protein